MKQLSYILLILIASQACGDRCVKLEGPRERYEQSPLPFHDLEIHTPAQVTLTKDTLARHSVELFAQPEVYHVLETEVLDSTYVVALDGCFRDKEALLLDVTMPKINRIYFGSAGKVTSSSLIDQDSLRLENTGLGDIDMVVRCHQVIAHSTSSGNILLSGEANRAVSLASGAGEISAFNLIADTAVVHTIGNGIIQVYAQDWLEVHFHRPTVVEYRGQPDSIVVIGDGTLIDANL